MSKEKPPQVVGMRDLSKVTKGTITMVDPYLGEIKPPYVTEGTQPMEVQEFINRDACPSTLYPSIFKAPVLGQNNLCPEQLPEEPSDSMEKVFNGIRDYARNHPINVVLPACPMIMNQKHTEESNNETIALNFDFNSTPNDVPLMVDPNIDSRTPAIMLTETEFDQQFTLVKNHLDENASCDGYMFETYGAEVDYVMSYDVQHVWTYQDNDYGQPCITNGKHVVNRIGYFISEQPWEMGKEYYIAIDTIDE